MERTASIHIRHPMQADTEVFFASLSGPAGLERAHLNLVRVPPGETVIQHEGGMAFYATGSGETRKRAECVAKD